MGRSETFENVLAMPPSALQEWLMGRFLSEPLPEGIDTPDEMTDAARRMLRLTSYYSYLESLLGYAKIAARDLRRGGSEKKEEYEDMVDKRDCIEMAAGVVKQQYAAISRAVTIHQENNIELRMNGSGYIR